MYWESDVGTFDRTDSVPYELFCCGITLMMDGKIATAGSNFVSGSPNSRTAVYDPVTNHWTATEEQGYWMNMVRYYPTLTRMPSGKIVVSGGQANEVDPDTWWITDVPFEVNQSITDLQAPWSTPVMNTDYFLQNYPFLYPISATELFMAGGSRRENNGDFTKYATFVFDTAAVTAGVQPFGGYSQLWHGPPVMYRPGLILKTGGAEELTQVLPNEPKKASPEKSREA
jgi:hypothetical protein